MAEKEERILVARSTDYTITDTDKGALFEGEIEPHCANVFTRAEAIEKMAKALYEHQYQKTRPLWEDEDNGYVEIYLKRAEAALNSLLGE